MAVHRIRDRVPVPARSRATLDRADGRPRGHPGAPAAALGPGGHPLHDATGEWIYELTDPLALRGWVPGRDPSGRARGLAPRQLQPLLRRPGRRPPPPPSTPPEPSSSSTDSYRTVARVSVLLPVRDAEDTLCECLDSLAAQTLSDHEVVAVDDGSQRRQRRAARGPRLGDPRLRVLRTAPLGLVPALNRGLEVAPSPLVARMDADDVAHPERLERQVGASRE